MNVGMRVLAGGLLLAAMACTKPGAVQPPEIANPASVHCEEQGGTVELVDAPEGQYGICVLPDGTRCEEWTFLRGECPCGDCPMWSPPGPDFCTDGTIMAGSVSTCGCVGPPVCERPPMMAALTHRSGRYLYTLENGSTWEYVYDIHAVGTRSERRIGWLRADGLGRAIVTAQPGDTIATPWGVMQRMPDTLYERGFLLERTHEQPIEPSAGSAVEVPDRLLSRNGRWEGRIEPWTYNLLALAMGSRSERRIGRLRFSGTEVSGEDPGDFVDTPWGPLVWTGPIDLGERTDYEQGFLLKGARDRALEPDGEIVFPSWSTWWRTQGR